MLEVGPSYQVKRLRRRRPKGGVRSLREIADELFQAGHANTNGVPQTRSDGSGAIVAASGELVGAEKINAGSFDGADGDRSRSGRDVEASTRIGDEPRQASGGVTALPAWLMTLAEPAVLVPLKVTAPKPWLMMVAEPAFIRGRRR